MSAGHVAVTHLGGDAFAIDLGPHRVVVDQPASAGGEDRGPTPTDLFVGSLAACAGFFAWRFLRRHVPVGTSLAIGCVFDMSEDRPSRVAAVRLVIDVGAPLTDELHAGLVRAAERCTVRNTLENAPPVGVTVRETASVIYPS